MGETLEALRRLQDVELQLAAIRRKREAKTRRLAAHERQARQADERLEAHRRKTRERQIKLDNLTLEVGSREQSINKHREALNKAKTNKEYGSILAAMNTEKADTAKLESSVLQLMDEIHELQNGATEIEAEKARILENVSTVQKALQAFDDESREGLNELEAKREEYAANIPPATLASFTRVAQRHEGEAMAPITRLHPKREEYLCEGCHMKVTLEIVNALQTRDEIQLCNCCGRILYLDAALAKH